MRRTKSESNIKRAERIINNHKKFKNAHSMSNINISTSNIEIVKDAKQQNNILYINKNLHKSDNFMQRINLYTTSTSSLTGTNSTIGIKINHGISKTNLSMLSLDRNWLKF